MNLQQIKSLNIEKWSTDNVCDWLKGEQRTLLYIFFKYLATIIFPDKSEDKRRWGGMGWGCYWKFINFFIYLSKSF